MFKNIITETNNFFKFHIKGSGFCYGGVVPVSSLVSPVEKGMNTKDQVVSFGKIGSNLCWDPIYTVPLCISGYRHQNVLQHSSRKINKKTHQRSVSETTQKSKEPLT